MLVIQLLLLQLIHNSNCHVLIVNAKVIPLGIFGDHVDMDLVLSCTEPCER